MSTTTAIPTTATLYPEFVRSEIDILNDLIATCLDGKEGFKLAAEDAKDLELKEIFSNLSRQREEFAQRLQAQVRSLGGKLREHGTLSGALHRGWINIKAAIASRDNHAVLAECESGEDAALKAYSDAASGVLGLRSRELVESQLARVQETHNRIRDLRDHPAYRDN
jgi:uncharacterized protein (TIGR02284 family)